MRQKSSDTLHLIKLFHVPGLLADQAISAAMQEGLTTVNQNLDPFMGHLMRLGLAAISSSAVPTDASHQMLGQSMF